MVVDVLSCVGVWGMGVLLTHALAVHLSLPALFQTNETSVASLPHPHSHILLLCDLKVKFNM